jgi:CheY-like chemotaxis protein
MKKNETILSPLDMPLNILLADDDEDESFIFEKVLKTLPFNLSFNSVGNGEALIKYLLKANTLPDVLFLDYNMPGKNGAEALTEIKQHDLLKKLPVIIYSTYFHEDMADTLYEKGAHFYFCKTDLKKTEKILHQIFSSMVLKNIERPSRKLFVLTPLEA